MQQTAQLPATIPALNLNAETIRATFQTIKDKQVRACAAMSQIKAITTDAEDKAANDLLVKVRLTMNGKEGIRGVIDMTKELTDGIDALRDELITPKKLMKEEEDRLRALRNAWAATKSKAQQAETDRIAKEKAQADEISRVKAAMRESVTTGIIAIITDLNESIRKYVAGMTLADWDSKAARLNVKPALKEEKYDTLFLVHHDMNIITQELFWAIVAEIKKELPYEKINAQYVEQAAATIKMWTDDLPKIKAALQQAEAKRESDPVASVFDNQIIVAVVDSKANTTAAALQQQQATAAAEIAKQHDQERLNNEVAATVQQQATPAQKGIRKGRVAVLSCPDEQLESTILAVVRACMSHPKFSGHLKRDRKGTLIGTKDEPVYAEWLQPLLTFIAKEADQDIPGITWKETVTTIAK